MRYDRGECAGRQPRPSARSGTLGL